MDMAMANMMCFCMSWCSAAIHGPRFYHHIGHDFSFQNRDAWRRLPRYPGAGGSNPDNAVLRAPRVDPTLLPPFQPANPHAIAHPIVFSRVPYGLAEQLDGTGRRRSLFRALQELLVELQHIYVRPCYLPSLRHLTSRLRPILEID